jgi:hypothetical protein
MFSVLCAGGLLGLPLLNRVESKINTLRDGCKNPAKYPWTRAMVVKPFRDAISELIAELPVNLSAADRTFRIQRLFFSRHFGRKANLHNVQPEQRALTILRLAGERMETADSKLFWSLDPIDFLFSWSETTSELMTKNSCMWMRLAYTSPSEPFLGGSTFMACLFGCGGYSGHLWRSGARVVMTKQTPRYVHERLSDLERSVEYLHDFALYLVAAVRLWNDSQTEEAHKWKYPGRLKSDPPSTKDKDVLRYYTESVISEVLQHLSCEHHKACCCLMMMLQGNYGGSWNTYGRSSVCNEWPALLETLVMRDLSP